MRVFKEFVEEVSQKSLFIRPASNVKFTTLINPNDNPVLQFAFEISYDNEGQLKIKNTTTFGETMALKLTHKYKVIS